MDTFTPLLGRYIQLEQHLKEANTQINVLRKERSETEQRMADYYKNGVLSEPEIILSKSNLRFVVKPPGGSKGWTLGKGDLEKYLKEMLPNGQDVFDELVRRHSPKLVSTEFAFELKPLKEKDGLHTNGDARINPR